VPGTHVKIKGSSSSGSPPDPLAIHLIIAGAQAGKPNSAVSLDEPVGQAGEQEEPAWPRAAARGAPQIWVILTAAMR
jgi:hypothetical protein